VSLVEETKESVVAKDDQAEDSKEHAGVELIEETRNEPEAELD
jgi:hypothetical protein